MPQRQPLFSIAATTYNHGNCIKATIDSVLKQTNQDFEIIIVDDGSPDNTRDEVLSIKDERIKYIYQENSGLPALSRNKAIRQSQGKYIALLDGDDAWYSDKLEKVLAVFTEKPQIDIVCHDEKISVNGRFLKRTVCGPYPEDMYHKLLWEGNALNISTTVLKREVFFKHNFWFDEDKKLFSVEDYDFWLRLAELREFNFYYLPEILSEHAVLEKSAVLSNIEKYTVNMLSLFDKSVKKHDLQDAKTRKMVRMKRSSIMRSAALSYNYKKEYQKSLYWFRKAIKEYPMNINNYLGLVFSIFRIRLGRI